MQLLGTIHPYNKFETNIHQYNTHIVEPKKQKIIHTCIYLANFKRKFVWFMACTIWDWFLFIRQNLLLSLPRFWVLYKFYLFILTVCVYIIFKYIISFYFINNFFRHQYYSMFIHYTNNENSLSPFKMLLPHIIT